MDKIINQTLTLLNANDEWKIRYEGYLRDIWNNSKKWDKGFHKPEGLSIYSTVGGRNNSEYILRYRGQTVAKIWSKGTKIELLSCVKSNDKYFTKCPLKKEAEKKDWNSKEASAFRRFFKQLDGEVKIKSQEHTVENALLKEFRKKDSKIKALLNIQPVLLHGQFFQMPTPLSASGSDKEIKYANEKGGGIDMLARIRAEDGRIRLCVCELKDENKPSESQRKAMSQAIAYATFIAKLVTEQPAWWEFFMGHKQEIGRNPSTLDKTIIEVVTIMPSGMTEICDSESFELQSLDGISLRCRSLYYDKNKYENWLKSSGKEEDRPFVFSGTFLNDIKR